MKDMFSQDFDDVDVKAIFAAMFHRQEQAKKHDDGKPAMDLLVPEFLLGLGDVMAHGAKKYGRDNWKQNIDTNRLYAACQRHLNQYHAGENLDKDSGLAHLLHAADNVMMLYFYDIREK